MNLSGFSYEKWSIFYQNTQIYQYRRETGNNSTCGRVRGGAESKARTNSLHLHDRWRCF